MYDNYGQWNPQLGYTQYPEEELVEDNIDTKLKTAAQKLAAGLTGRGTLVAQNGIPATPTNIDGGTGGTLNRNAFAEQAAGLMGKNAPSGKPQSTAPVSTPKDLAAEYEQDKKDAAASAPTPATTSPFHTFARKEDYDAARKERENAPTPVAPKAEAPLSVTSSKPYTGSLESTPQDATSPKLNITQGVAAGTPRQLAGTTSQTSSETTPLAPTPVATPAVPTPAAPTPAAKVAPGVSQAEYEAAVAKNKNLVAAGLPELPLPKKAEAPVAPTPAPTIAEQMPIQRDTSKPYWQKGVQRTKDGISYRDAAGKSHTITSKEMAAKGIKPPAPGKLDAAWMKAAGEKLGKYPVVNKPAQTTTTGAAPAPTGVQVPAATATKEGMPAGQLAVTSNQAKNAQSTQTDQKSINPELASQAQGLIKSGTDAQSDFAKQLQLMLGPLEESAKQAGTDKQAALARYSDSMSGERKSQMWDAIIRGLGKVTAGAVGIHGLGVGGKSIIKPGLDVAKYYDPGEAYSPKIGQEQAKTVLEQELKKSEDAGTVSKEKIALLKMIREAKDPQSALNALTEMMKLTGGTTSTGTAREQGATSTVKPDDAALAKLGKTAAAKDDKSQAIGTGDVDAFNKANQARIAKQNSAVATNINNEATAIQSLASSNDSVPTDGLRTMWQEEFAKVQDPKKAADAVQGKLRALYNVPTDTNSKEYALWYFDVYQPMAAYGANIGLPSDRGILKTTSGSRSYDYIPNRNEYSEYAQAYKSLNKGTDAQKHEWALDILRGRVQGGMDAKQRNDAAKKLPPIESKESKESTAPAAAPNALKEDMQGKMKKKEPEAVKGRKKSGLTPPSLARPAGQ